MHKLNFLFRAERQNRVDYDEENLEITEVDQTEWNGSNGKKNVDMSKKKTR